MLYFSLSSSHTKIWKMSMHALKSDQQHLTHQNGALSNTGPVSVKQQRKLCQPGSSGGRHKPWPDSYVSNHTDVRAAKRCFWQISSRCLRQQQSSADQQIPPAGMRPSSMRGLCRHSCNSRGSAAALGVIASQLSLRKPATAILHIIAIKKKYAWLNNFSQSILFMLNSACKQSFKNMHTQKTVSVWSFICDKFCTQ